MHLFCAIQGGGIMVDGRLLCVTVAVAREQAQKLVQKSKEKAPKDTRNLHLAREGREYKHCLYWFIYIHGDHKTSGWPQW